MSCLKFSECCRKKMSPVWYQVLRESIAVSEHALEESLGTVAKPCDLVHVLISALSSHFACDFEFLSLQVNEI